ncbi:MAG: TatD family hydrolase [Candidatus Micrarchaeia archaeon]
MPQREQSIEKTEETLSITEMADAHCHLDLLGNDEILKAIKYGVQIMISDGVDTRSNVEVLKLSDQRHIFAAIGIDPEHSLIGEDELEFNINLAKSNYGKLVAIGEIGLDAKFMTTQEAKDKQRHVFERFLELAIALNLPVSVHARGAIGEVLDLLEEKGVKKAHLHFFEGSIEQAKRAERNGYMISIPPLKSSRRDRIIKNVAIDYIMAESDAPMAGKSPIDVEKSIQMVALAKGISFEKAAETLLINTKRFFNIVPDIMRS